MKKIGNKWKRRQNQYWRVDFGLYQVSSDAGDDGVSGRVSGSVWCLLSFTIVFFLILYVLIFWFISVNKLLMRVLVPIHLFVKIFKKLVCHIDIGGCKIWIYTGSLLNLFSLAF